MDAHTLELLEFERLRAIVAGYAATSLGRDEALAIVPLHDMGEIDQRLQETEELLELVRTGLGPPLGGMTDVRPQVRRAMTHATLSADEICDVAAVLRVVGDVRQWVDRNTSQSPRLAAIGFGLTDFSSLKNTIEGCLDERGEMLDTASRKLSNIRGEIRSAEARIQATLRNLIRTLDSRGLLRYANYTMVGHHYVVPVIRERRGEVPGSVQRTSASSETVYVEPAAIADQSAQLSFLRDKEKQEIRRILHWLSEQIGQVGEDVMLAVGKMAQLDFALARARYAQDFRHFRPTFGKNGIFLRSARHPLLEHMFREESNKPVEPTDEVRSDTPVDAPPSTDSDRPSEAADETEATEESGREVAAKRTPDARFAGLPAGMSPPKPETPVRKPKPPAPSPVFMGLPKAGEKPPETPVQEELEEESEDSAAVPVLKGGLGVDYAALAEKRKAEKAAKAAARAAWIRPVVERPAEEKRRTAVATGPKREVTPIDIHLGFDYRILVVTGPNTGGKTVALKSLGLISVMAQCGLFVPAAEGSQVVLLNDILADIGDEQSLQQSLSTFSSHMKRITTILGRADDRTLVLLDEVGAGTDPAEGSALGRAIVDELDSLGVLAVVTTHLGELKSIALANPRVRNANVEFDLESLKPLYRVRIGEAGRSHALTIARRLNLPGHVVDRAEEYLKQESPGGTAEFDDLQRLRADAEKARQEALTAQADARRLQEELEKALAEQRGKDLKAQELQAARERLKVGDRVVVPRLGYDRPGRIAKVDAKKRVVSVSIGHMKWDAQLDEVIPLEDSPPLPGPKPQYREPR